ncbi:MAG: SPOR domain-containing protein [Sedimenticola thiotaurini]|uniref:SPOR domain-containing protein n=1 Tax=Sedimenticola thiotaurini TaxID=1543721 RepID=A0A558CP81_9GAMM|nr:MAG: SPOR domain-containing protein [Sedimenticola thiotaurini]
MKWLAILLVLANLLVLGWGLQREAVDRPQKPAVHAGVGNLKLLSEILESSMQTQHPDPVVTEEQRNPDRQNSLIPSTSESANNPDDAQTEEPVAENAVPEVQAIPVEQTSEGRIPVDVKEAESAQNEQAADKTMAQPGKTINMVCGAFGPFERGAVARELSESLSSQGMDASLRRESMEKPIGYWVIIPPLESQQAAIKKVSELRASGISDIRRFVKGEQKNGISLGVFSSKVNAQVRQQEIAKKGHAAKVIPRLIVVPTYWVDYRADQERAGRAVETLRQRNEAIKNTEYPCSRVVTSGGIF